MARLGTVEQLLEPWRTHAAPALIRAHVGLCGVALTAGLLLARRGTLASRFVGLGAVVVAAALLVLTRVRVRKREQNPRAAIEATILQTEPSLGRAALRAVGLAHRTAERTDTGSDELARLHVGRVLGRAKVEPLLRRAERQAWVLSVLGAALAVVAFAVVVVDPYRMVEGLDILVARRGEAPVPIAWFGDAEVFAEAPPYLGGETLYVDPVVPSGLPVGSIVTVRAEPLHVGRRLVLTDGASEVAFQVDARGRSVARWIVLDDSTLRVGARFGDVIISDPRSLLVHAIVDQTPVVRLEKAPATLKLLEHPRIPVHWEASDDHGLAEVQLVLRSGEREERRELAKPAGATDAGGIDLLAKDKFLDKSYVPIEVTVEARDADPIRGPKWGRSPAIVVVPPQVGELEALRHAALVEARNALTDLLADRLTYTGRRDRAWLAAQRKVQGEVSLRVLTALKRDFGGLRIPGRVTAAARGQLERLDLALVAAERAQSQQNIEKLEQATETTLLGLDSVIEALATRDARSTSKKLAEVATEVATAIKLGREPGERARAERRYSAAMGVLEGGGKHLVALGGLGFDLGEIVENGVGRIRRAMTQSDRHHARLAAEDLAVRLRTPDPSFSSSGSGSMGGTEAGATGAEDGPASEAAADAESLERALEELRREHASELERTERALDEGAVSEDDQASREELRRLAEQVRDAVKDLPEQATEPSSSESDAAQARAQAEGMASSLERGELGEASEQGQRAVDALDRAGKKMSDSPRGTREADFGPAVERAASKMRSTLKEATSRSAERRKRASEAAKSLLDDAARRERALADRARQLRERSEASQAPLPEDMLDKLDEASRRMEQAARELKARRGEKGVESQREAQRLLEMAQPEKEDGGERGHQPSEGGSMAQDADVPGNSADESAARFRRRVTEGLGRRTPGTYRDAVRRYTEGLLR